MSTATAAISQGDTGVIRRKEGKYLTFALGREEYGLEILKVREIFGYMDITAIPRTPSCIKGVINLRGQVIAVVDLRAKFGMEPAERTEQTCIIVVEIRRAGRKVCTGIVVDRVSEVLDVPGDKIEDAPSFGSSVDSDFILGMGKIGDSVKILLDIDKVLDADDLAAAIAGSTTDPAEAN
ncbi:MAG: chemotaxis protein CheW [Tepidisphaerales bacterium]